MTPTIESLYTVDQIREKLDDGSLTEEQVRNAYEHGDVAAAEHLGLIPRSGWFIDSRMPWIPFISLAAEMLVRAAERYTDTLIDDDLSLPSCLGLHKASAVPPYRVMQGKLIPEPMRLFLRAIKGKDPFRSPTWSGGRPRHVDQLHSGIWTYGWTEKSSPSWYAIKEGTRWLGHYLADSGDFDDRDDAALKVAQSRAWVRPVERGRRG